MNDDSQGIGEPGATVEPPTVKLVTLADEDSTLPDPVLWSARAGKRSPLLSVGEIAVFSGPGGIGKSSVALAVAAAAGAPRHGEACGLAVRPGPVVFASYEDSAPRMAHRLRWFAGGVADDGRPAAGHVLAWKRPRPLWTVDPEGATIEADEWGPFWRAVREAGAQLVILDPVSVALLGVSASDSGAVRDFLDRLTYEAERAECGVLLIGHDTKSARNQARAGEDPGAGAVAGSGAWFDGARGILYLWRERGSDTRILECIKSNYGPTGWGARLRPRWDGDPPRRKWRGLELAEGLTPQQVEIARALTKKWKPEKPADSPAPKAVPSKNDDPDGVL